MRWCAGGRRGNRKTEIRRPAPARFVDGSLAASPPAKPPLLLHTESGATGMDPQLSPPAAYSKYPVAVSLRLVRWRRFCWLLGSVGLRGQRAFAFQLEVAGRVEWGPERRGLCVRAPILVLFTPPYPHIPPPLRCTRSPLPPSHPSSPQEGPAWLELRATGRSWVRGGVTEYFKFGASRGRMHGRLLDYASALSTLVLRRRPEAKLPPFENRFTLPFL